MDTNNPTDGNAPKCSDGGGPNVPTDGRGRYEWETRYPTAAREIFWEGAYLFSILFLSLFVLFATWKGWTCIWLGARASECATLRRYAILASSGMLGGIAFGMKFFYRVVASGYWNQDRRPWRIMSPFLAMVVSIIVGAMFIVRLIHTDAPPSGSYLLIVGFISGYFADEAVGKMYDVASVIFGRTVSSKDGPEKGENAQNKPDKSE